MADLNDDLTPNDDQPQGAIDMLQADHRRVRTLFQHYQSTNDQSMKRRIAEQIFVELEVHAQLEEMVFYPAFEAAADAEGEVLVEDARQEHLMVKELIADLRSMDATDEEFEPQFEALMVGVEDHVQEEETAMFPEAEEVLADESADLLEDMQEIKQQLLAS